MLYHIIFVTYIFLHIEIETLRQFGAKMSLTLINLLIISLIIKKNYLRYFYAMQIAFIKPRLGHISLRRLVLGL